MITTEENNVVGYLDLTKNYEENEPYDVFVKDEYRRKGYGKKTENTAQMKQQGRNAHHQIKKK